MKTRKPGGLVRLLVLAGALALTGCGGRNEVVVYCALDREFAEPILTDFHRQSGIRVLARYDTESTKSVGLAEQILREKNRPRCDVFWNNEIVQTIRLARDGALAPCRSEAGIAYPETFRSPVELWYGFAARVRVLLVNTERVPAGSEPSTLEDLTDPAWRGEVGIAKPLFGTTATHVAALFAHWGPEPAKDWLGRLKANDVQILAGNKQVAIAVGSGELAMGLTDTDDALGEIRLGRPVKLVYLDAGPDQMGLLFIPNTVSLVAGAPDPENGAQLIDYLLSPEVEARLALGKSGQIPLHPAAGAQPALGLPEGAKRMDVSFDAAVDQWESATRFLKEEFTTD